MIKIVNLGKLKKCVSDMNREQALDVIKEIFALCHHIEGRSVKLISPDTNSLLSKEYQVHIETKNNQCLDQCLRMIADHNDLAVNSEGGFLTIYKRQS